MCVWCVCRCVWYVYGVCMCVVCVCVCCVCVCTWHVCAVCACLVNVWYVYVCACGIHVWCVYVCVLYVCVVYIYVCVGVVCICVWCGISVCMGIWCVCGIVCVCVYCWIEGFTFHLWPKTNSANFIYLQISPQKCIRDLDAYDPKGKQSFLVLVLCDGQKENEKETIKLFYQDNWENWWHILALSTFVCALQFRGLYIHSLIHSTHTHTHTRINSFNIHGYRYR